MTIHRTPEDEEIEAAYEAQGKTRYITLENPSIENAWGVYDYDGELWIMDPYRSQETADHLRNTRNKGAVRL